MLALEIASLPERQKASLQKRYLDEMVAGVKGWNLEA
jgi:hypothetical protein